MKSRKRYDAVATTGEYTDPATGQKKKRYTNVGTVFESEDGRLSLKLDTIPIGPGWSGYIQFFEPQNRNSPPPAQPPSTSSQPPSAPDTDEIPF
jgi:hypothetical protein